MRLKATEESGNEAESYRGAWERGCGTPTQVPLHTPSHGSIPVPSAPLRGGERGKSGVKDQWHTRTHSGT